MINFFVEPELFSSNINDFDKNWIPKDRDWNVSFAGRNGTFIYIRIHIHNQLITQPKKLTSSMRHDSGEYENTIECVLPYFSFFIYSLGKCFGVQQMDIKLNKYLLYNLSNDSESICLDYRREIGQLNEANENVIFIINHKLLNGYDTEKFINIINIADGNIGVYVKKNYKDFCFNLLPSKNLNLPLLNLGNEEYKPKLNIILEDKVFTQSFDPFPKGIEEKLDNETIFLRIYSTTKTDITFKKEGIQLFSYNLGTDKTIIILSKNDFSNEKVDKIGYKLIKNSYFKGKENKLYLIDGNEIDSNKVNNLEIFFFFNKQNDIRNRLKESLKSTFNPINKNDYDIYVNNNYKNRISINFV